MERFEERRVVARFVGAVNQHDSSSIASAVTPDVHISFAGLTPFEGRDRVLRYFEWFAGYSASWDLETVSEEPGFVRCRLAARDKWSEAAGISPLTYSRVDITIEDVLASPVVSDPYKRLDCCLISDGAAAVVIGNRTNAPHTDGARTCIAGIGNATDRVRLGDRPEPDVFSGKAKAAARAYEMAGISPAQIEVAEVYDSFTGAELQAIEALQIRKSGQAGPAMADGAFAADGALPVNLSGGLIGQGAANGAVGIAQVVTIDRVLTGRYWPALQPDPAPRVGLTDTHGGIATTCLVNVLQRVE